MVHWADDAIRSALANAYGDDLPHDVKDALRLNIREVRQEAELKQSEAIEAFCPQGSSTWWPPSVQASLSVSSMKPVIWPACRLSLFINFCMMKTAAVLLSCVGLTGHHRPF